MKMCKISFIIALSLLFWSLLNTSQAQIERYERKSVSLFRIKIPPEMSKEAAKVVFLELQNQLNALGRFDINPIPLQAGVSLEKVFAIAKEYAESHQLERASRQFELMDEHYKEERITGETLDKIIDGAYVIVPEIVNFKSERNVKKMKDKEGKEYLEVWLDIDYGLKIEVWNAENQGTFENPIWSPQMEEQDTLTAHGFASVSISKKSQEQEAKEKLQSDAINYSLNFLRLKMAKSLKSFDMFTIKAKVTKRNLKQDMVKFDFGKDVGLHRDDPFRVIYYEKDKKGNRKKVNLAYMKTREIAEHESRAQVLILYNPLKLKQGDLINPGDQVLEYPKLGFNVSAKTGWSPYSLSSGLDTSWMCYYDGSDTFYFHSGQQNITGAPTLNFEIESDLAPLGGPTELYVTNEYTFLMNYPIIGVVGELGVKKRIYKRRLELNGGANLGILWLWGKISHIPEGYATGDTTMYIGDSIPSGTSVFMRGFSTGLSLNAGWEYLLTPELALTFEGGYRLYIPIKNKMWDVWARYDEKNWDLDFDNFIAKPGPADISGYWYSFGVIFSL